MSHDTTPAAEVKPPLRVLICGDRNWTDKRPIALILRGLKTGPFAPHIIEGGARGADTLAGQSADRMALDHDTYPAKWDEHGRAAGPIRNQQMLTEGNPHVVFAFHNDITASKGTRDMCERARKAGLPVYVISRYDETTTDDGGR